MEPGVGVSSYWGLVMPAIVLFRAGMGAAFMPAVTLATHGIRPQDAGVASAMSAPPSRSEAPSAPRCST